MGWRFWLVDIPAAIVTLWWTAYRSLLLLVTMATVTALTVMLLLAALGIRWGW